VIFVEELDDIVNPLGVKGLGEIGIGKRIRELPITLDKLI
jgi:xanthine dehydrogenase YagR molybdenum-binding subunit